VLRCSRGVWCRARRAPPLLSRVALSDASLRGTGTTRFESIGPADESDRTVMRIVHAEHRIVRCGLHGNMPGWPRAHRPMRHAWNSLLPARRTPAEASCPTPRAPCSLTLWKDPPVITQTRDDDILTIVLDNERKAN